MRKLGLPVIVTVIAWIAFLACVYVLNTAPDLLWLMRGMGTESGQYSSFVGQNYRDLGLFMSGITVALFLMAAMSTWFLISNIRISIKSVSDEQEKPKHRPVINSVESEDDQTADLAELIEIEQQKRRR